MSFYPLNLLLNRKEREEIMIVGTVKKPDLIWPTKEDCPLPQNQEILKKFFIRDSWIIPLLNCLKLA